MTIRRAIPNPVSADRTAACDFSAGFLGLDEDGFTMFASPSNRTAQITVAARDNPGQDRGVSEARGDRQAMHR